MSRFASQAIVLSIARIGNYGLMLLSPVVLSRILTIEEFGLYREFLVYTTVLLVVASFNISDSLFYFVPAHPERRWTVIRQAVLMVAFFSLPVLALVGVADLVTGGAIIGHFLVPMLLYVFFFVNVDFWECYWLATGRPVALFVYTSVRLVARMTVVICAAVFTHDLDVIVWSLVALEALRMTASWFAWRTITGRESSAVDRELLRSQLRYCIPVGSSQILTTIGRNLGNITVVKMLGPASLALYSIGFYGEPIIAALRNSISSVLLPEMVRRASTGDGSHLPIWKRGTVLNAIVLLPIAVLLVRYAEPIIVTLFGEPYRAATPVLQFYALIVVREFFDLTLPLRAVNRTAPLVQGSVVGMTSSFVLLWLLVPRHGIAGAALAIASAAFIEAGFLAWSVRRVSGWSYRLFVPWRELGRCILAAALASPLILVPAAPGIAGLLVVGAVGAVYVAVYLVLLRLLRVAEVEPIWRTAGRITQRMGLRLGSSGA